MEGGDITSGVGDNDQSTPIATRNAKGGKYLVRRAVDKTRKTYLMKLP